MEKIIAIILFFCGISQADIRITGKKMELRPKQNLAIFSDGAVVTHSSFTLRADKIIQNDSTKEISASGKIEFESAHYRLMGDTAHYSVTDNSGSVTGLPAMGSFTIENGEILELTANKICYTMEQLTAKDYAILSYATARIKSPLITYNITEKKASANPLTKMILDDSKYFCEFSAGKMLFLQESRKIKLANGVKGKIAFKQ